MHDLDTLRALNAEAAAGRRRRVTHNGLAGRTYGGDPDLIHIPDQHRADTGLSIANMIDAEMRLIATLGVGHPAEPMGSDKPLCPGCYMIALFDAAVVLAERYGQPVTELGDSLGDLFYKLAREGKYRPTEEMFIRSEVNPA